MIITERRPDGSLRVALSFAGEQVRTKQADLESADINNIMRKFKKTGLMPVMNGHPIFGDFSNVEDFHTHMDKVVRFKAEFDMLPGQIRKRFDNDPANIIDWLADPKNDPEAVKLGLKDRSVLPIEVPPVAPAPVPPVVP